MNYSWAFVFIRYPRLNADRIADSLKASGYRIRLNPMQTQNLPKISLKHLLLKIILQKLESILKEQSFKETIYINISLI